MKSNHSLSVPRRAISTLPGTTALARLIAAYAPHDGAFDLRVPGVHVFRVSRAEDDCLHTLRVPSLSLIAQGAKRIIVGNDTYDYHASRMIVFSVALPLAAQITQARHSAPYLSLRLDLDPRKMAELVHLQEAKRLMLSAMVDASTASQRVGYLSASQFSREYSRFFGSAPTRDIARLRHHGPGQLEATA